MKRYDQFRETPDRQAFNAIDIAKSVMVEGQKHEILKKGSNFLITLAEDGDVRRIWASNVETQSEPVDYLTGIFKNSSIDESLKSKFLDSLSEFNESYTDKYILLIAFRNVEDGGIEQKSIREKLESINQFNHTYLRETMYTEDDRLKVARIIAETFKADIGATPAETIQNVLSSDKVGALTLEQQKNLSKMLEIATEVGIEVEPEDDIEDATLGDEDIDNLINTHLAEEDYYDVYDDDEFSLVDEETGEKIEEDLSEHANIMEVLSRMERIKARIRFARTEANRTRKLQIALDKRSNTATLSKRARRLAVKAVERRLTKKDPAALSVSEKERVEKRISKMGNVLKRISARLLPKVRKLEKDRLTNKHHTKDE